MISGGENGRASLFGSVGGSGGHGAASRAHIQPAANQAYAFNGCEIGTSGCTFSTVQSPPVQVPRAIWWFLLPPYDPALFPPYPGWWGHGS